MSEMSISASTATSTRSSSEGSSHLFRHSGQEGKVWLEKIEEVKNNPKPKSYDPATIKGEWDQAVRDFDTIDKPHRVLRKEDPFHAPRKIHIKQMVDTVGRMRIANEKAKARLAYQGKTCCNQRKPWWLSRMGTTFDILVGLATIGLIFQDVIIVLLTALDPDSGNGNSTSTTMSPVDGVTISQTLGSTTTTTTTSTTDLGNGTLFTTTTTTSSSTFNFGFDSSQYEEVEIDLSFIYKFVLLLVNIFSSVLRDKLYEKADALLEQLSKLEEMIGENENLRVIGQSIANIKFWKSARKAVDTGKAKEFAALGAQRHDLKSAIPSPQKGARDNKIIKDKVDGKACTCYNQDWLSSRINVVRLVEIDQEFSNGMALIEKSSTKASGQINKLLDQEVEKIDIKYEYIQILLTYKQLQKRLEEIGSIPVDTFQKSKCAKSARMWILVGTALATMGTIAYETYEELTEGDPSILVKTGVLAMYFILFVIGRGNDCCHIAENNEMELRQQVLRIHGYKRHVDGLKVSYAYFKAMQEFSNMNQEDRAKNIGNVYELAAKSDSARGTYSKVDFKGMRDRIALTSAAGNACKAVTEAGVVPAQTGRLLARRADILNVLQLASRDEKRGKEPRKIKHYSKSVIQNARRHRQSIEEEEKVREALAESFGNKGRADTVGSLSVSVVEKDNSGFDSDEEIKRLDSGVVKDFSLIEEEEAGKPGERKSKSITRKREGSEADSLVSSVTHKYRGMMDLINRTKAMNQLRAKGSRIIDLKNTERFDGVFNDDSDSDSEYQEESPRPSAATRSNNFMLDLLDRVKNMSFKSQKTPKKKGGNVRDIEMGTIVN